MTNKNLLVIAGATISIDKSGVISTKEPIVKYLEELSDYFDKCTWISAHDQKVIFEGQINRNKIDVVIVNPGKINRAKAWIRALLLSCQHNYVIYFMPSPFLPVFPFIKLFSKRLGVYLAGDYEVGIDWYTSQRWFGWPTLMRMSFELPMKHADFILARGKRLARIGSRFNKIVYQTVPMGHMASNYNDVMQYSINICPKDQFSILFIGKVVESKGVGILIEAMRKIISDNKDNKFHLYIVGEGADKDKYQRLTLDYNLQDTISFEGWVSSQQEMDKYFHMSDLLTVPSIYPEGVPRVIDEAIVRGLPVISTPVGGIGEEFEDGEVYFVHENNAYELAEGIHKMLFDLEHRKKSLERARKRRDFFLKNNSAAQQHIKILIGTI